MTFLSGQFLGYVDTRKGSADVGFFPQVAYYIRKQNICCPDGVEQFAYCGKQWSSWVESPEIPRVILPEHQRYH